MTEREAGRALDAEVAERIFGAEVERGATELWEGGIVEDGLCFASSVSDFEPAGDRHGSPVPYYSTEIDAAWEVVEKLQERGLYVSISKPPDASTWDVRGWEPATNDNRFIAHAETAPLTICLAALAALQATGDGDTTE